MTPDGGPIRVLTVDDHPVFRQGIRHLLEGEGNLDPVGEVGSVDEAVAWLRSHRADVVLLDHGLPGTNGVDGLRQLLAVRDDLQVIVLTVCDEDEVFLRAIRNGACGYVLKDAPPERLIDAIDAAARGECCVSGQLTRILFERVARHGAVGAGVYETGGGDSALVPPIAPREREVLACLAKGLTNKEIARELGLSPNTVRNQLQRLEEKLHARNRVQLALFAREYGCA